MHIVIHKFGYFEEMNLVNIEKIILFIQWFNFLFKLPTFNNSKTFVLQYLKSVEKIVRCRTPNSYSIA